MGSPPVDPADVELTVEVYNRNGGNLLATAKELGLNRSTVRERLRQAGALKKPLVAGAIHGLKSEVRRPPKRGVHRYILTSAQNNTKVPDQLWDNLLALAAHYDAELIVGTFSYNTNAYGKLAVKRGREQIKQFELWFDPRLIPYIRDTRIQLAPDLIWCGEMNILPTAAQPLRGLETYTGTASMIIPHVKQHVRSIPRMPGTPPKINYTSGTVTMRNYIQKREGLKAEFHHIYGGLLVEVDDSGDWFARQLNADSKWTIHDLLVKVENGEVKPVDRVEAVTWGDVHCAQLDEEVASLAFQTGGILDQLKPQYQFIHDVLDFRARNHHESDNPHARFELFVKGQDRVQNEVADVRDFLLGVARPWCRTVVVDSNHDRALERWLREGSFRNDPVNALFYLRAQTALYESIAAGKKDFHLLKWATGLDDAPFTFLKHDQSFNVGGIEYGMHGDLGPKGSKGSPYNLSKVGAKSNIGHGHAAWAGDGLFQAGTFSMLTTNYTRGPTDWSHTFIVTYENHKRSLITIRNRKWCA